MLNENILRPKYNQKLVSRASSYHVIEVKVEYLQKSQQMKMSILHKKLQCADSIQFEFIQSKNGYDASS